ncbi:hypothetical protein [Helicobacter pylori]|uniref:hypothetical protein n=1 Tax=Helicobacter pylori TaxID=210 RepID=UPI001920FD67|nr:hypothetical protein [Helicobacter pylori]QQW88700.1 hypothetical protein HG565_04540 [Helicobacter pylori]
MTNFYHDEDTGGYYSKRTGKRLHGAALYNAEAKHLNSGLKQTLDQNKELKKALFDSLSLLSNMGIRFR